MNAFKQHKNKIIISFALLIALASYVAFTHFIENKHNNIASQKKYESLFKAIKNGENISTTPSIFDQININEIKGKTHDVSYPTIGSLFVTTPAEVITQTSQLLLKDNTAPIKKNQRVLFYTSNGNLSEEEGQITNAQQTSDKKVKASYRLQKAPKNNTMSSADIVLREIGNIKRIPKTALSYEDGSYFVYLIKTKRDSYDNAIIVPDGKTIVGEVTKQSVQKTLEDKWHIAISHHIHKADLILLNPNTDIKNGDLIKIRVVKSPPPVLSNTEQWLKKVEKQRILDVKEGQKRADDCGLSAVIGATSTVNNETSSKPAGSCANSPSNSNTPFDAFELLGIERPAPENTIKLN